jgi:hypothetical protein
MNWTSPKPLDRDAEKPWIVAPFLREIHTRIKFGSFTWDPGSLPGTSQSDTSMTGNAFMGLRAGMSIHVTPPATLTAGVHVTGAWVANDNELTVRLYNSTGGAIDLGSGTWAFHGVVL